MFCKKQKRHQPREPCREGSCASSGSSPLKPISEGSHSQGAWWRWWQPATVVPHGGLSNCCEALGWQGQALRTGLDPAPHFHTPNNHREKQGLKVSSAESDTELLQRLAALNHVLLGQGLACRELSAFRSQGKSELCKSGARSSPTFTLVFTHPSPLQTVVHSPQLQGLYPVRHVLGRLDFGSCAAFNSSCSWQGMKPKHQDWSRFRQPGCKALPAHGLSKQRTLSPNGKHAHRRMLVFYKTITKGTVEQALPTLRLTPDTSQLSTCSHLTSSPCLRMFRENPC